MEINSKLQRGHQGSITVHCSPSRLLSSTQLCVWLHHTHYLLFFLLALGSDAFFPFEGNASAKSEWKHIAVITALIASYKFNTLIFISLTGLQGLLPLAERDRS